MTPTDTPATTAPPTAAPATTTPAKRARMGRGIVSVEPLHPAGLGAVVLVTLASMVVSSILILDLFSRMLGLDNAFATGVTAIGGALSWPFSWIRGDAILNGGNYYFAVHIPDFVAIAVYALVAYALAKVVRLGAGRRAVPA